MHLDAVEHDEKIIFMHAVQEGAASKSFGLQVAQLAGVPKTVIQRAKQRLSELENQQSASNISQQTQPFEQLTLMDESHPIIDKLKGLDVNELSPKQALDLLFQLKQEF